jgi:hypothetical protein
MEPTEQVPKGTPDQTAQPPAQAPQATPGQGPPRLPPYLDIARMTADRPEAVANAVAGYGIQAAIVFAAVCELAGGADREDRRITAAVVAFAVSLCMNLFAYLKLRNATGSPEALRAWLTSPPFQLVAIVGPMSTWAGVVSVFLYFSTAAGLVVIVLPVLLLLFSHVMIGPK